MTQAYTPFKDVADGEWFLEDLKYVSTRGIILGDENGYFNPEDNITRVQFMALLARFDFNAASTGAGWDAASVEWAKKFNISDGSDPDDPVTREQLVTMLWRYCGSPTADFDLSGFAATDALDAHSAR